MRVSWIVAGLIVALLPAGTLAQDDETEQAPSCDVDDGFKPYIVGSGRPPDVEPQGVDFGRPSLGHFREPVCALVEFTVTGKGTIADAVIVKSSHARFDNAVLYSVRRWRFEPGTLNGVPVPVRTRILIEIAFPG